MKKVLALVLGLCVVIGGCQIKQAIIGNYQFEKQFLFAWNLADKSSTIEAKANYIAQFVNLLETYKNNFSSYNAVWLKTPDNSLEKNIDAVKTLNSRLHEIMKMDVASFQYNTAIQQITAQEQGEATNLIYTIKGCWMKESYPMNWDWYGGVILIFWICGLIICGLIYLAKQPGIIFGYLAKLL